MAHVAWQPAPRFVEAATALAVAYLAVEILLLPQAGARWLVAGVLGALHGLYFHLFVQTTGYSPALVLLGAALAEVVGHRRARAGPFAGGPHGEGVPPGAGRRLGAPRLRHGLVPAPPAKLSPVHFPNVSQYTS